MILTALACGEANLDFVAQFPSASCAFYTALVRRIGEPALLLTSGLGVTGLTGLVEDDGL